MARIFTATVFLGLLLMIPITGHASEDALTVVATHETYEQAGGWLDFLQSKDVQVHHVTPLEYANGIDARYIVIMGGLDEPEGIKDIVVKILSEKEMMQVSQKDAAETFIKTVVPENVPPSRQWESAVNFIMFIGSDAEGVMKARSESKETWWEEIQIWFDIYEGAHMPAY